MAWLYQPILQATALLGQHSPSVVLNTPLDTGSVGPTPTLDFTGTDTESDDIRYRVQIHSNSAFGGVSDITLDNSASSETDGFSFTVGNHSNRLLLVSYSHYQGSGGISGVSFNGDALSLIVSQEGQFGEVTEIWGLVAPDIATGTITITGEGSWWGVGVLSLYNCKQSLPTNTAIFEDDTAGSITTVHDGSWVVSSIESEAVITQNDGTEYWNLEGASYQHGAGAYILKATAGLQVMDWSQSYGSRSNQALIEVEAYVETPLIDAISGTDLGFANPDNGGDTDPFTSGENIQYTVQAGDTLADGTYYWRVIAIDPSGSNVYGNWSEIRSFVVTSATSYTITKSLKYTVVKAITAITKSLKYTVKTTPATVTKTLRYFVNKAGTITKSLKYSVVKAITLTKSLKYTVFTNPTALTKSLKYSVLKSLTITKALIYKVQRSASAITKSLKYTVLKSLTVTKSLKYTIVKSATAITKSLKYSVIKATTITKSLTYEVVSATSTTITKSLTYAILKSYSITKSLTYLVRSPATITKSLKYAVIKAITLTKSLKYAVTKPGTITKQLIYKVLTSTTLTKSLSYMVTAGQTIQKSLKYAVVKATTLTKSLTYYVVNNGVIQRTLRYHVISQHTIDLDLSYRIITSGVITKSLRYVVSVPRGYRSALPSSRQTRPLDQVSGQAVDSTNKSTQLQTYQAKTIL